MRPPLARVAPKIALASRDLPPPTGPAIATISPRRTSRSNGTLCGVNWKSRRLNDGQPWRPRSPAAAIRAGVFLAGEDRWRSSLFPDSVPFASIAGTLSFPFLSRWFRRGTVKRATEREVATQAIASFGIRCTGPDDRLTRLSGGNQQKVVLARWHVEPARLLLLDEPFQGVDAGARADIADTLRRHAPRRATIVFVSDLEEAFEIADRVVRFDRATLDHHPTHDLSALSDR